MRSYFTPIRIVFWAIMAIAIAAIAAFLFGLWSKAHPPALKRSACIRNQRNIQDCVRAIQASDNQKVGDSIDWNRIFGPDFLRKKPVCPTHGDYEYSTVVPPRGESAVRCRDPKHLSDTTREAQ